MSWLVENNLVYSIMIKLKDIIPKMAANRNIIPPVLYHATFETLVNKISKYGLVPGGTTIGSPAQNFIESNKRFVYLGANKQKCEDLLQHLVDAKRSIKPTMDLKINVLTINTKMLDRKLFAHDPATPLLGMRAFTYEGTIPSNAIVDYGD